MVRQDPHSPISAEDEDEEDCGIHAVKCSLRIRIINPSKKRDYTGEGEFIDDFKNSLPRVCMHKGLNNRFCPSVSLSVH